MLSSTGSQLRNQILVIKDYLSLKGAGQVKEKQGMGKRTKWYYQYNNPQLAFARRTFNQSLCVLSVSVGAFIMRLALESGRYIP